MHRLCRTKQYRADSDAVTGYGFEQIEGNVGRVERWHDQQVGLTLEPRVRENFQADFLVERRIAVHFPLDFQLRRALLENFARLAHLQRGRVARTAEIGMRQKRDLWGDPEALDLVGRHHRDLRNLLRGRVRIDVGIADKQRAVGQDQHVHRGELIDTLAQADDSGNVVHVQRELRDRPAQHRVRVAAADHQRADQRGASGHFALGIRHRNALAPHQIVVLLPVIAKARIRVRIDDLEILVRSNAQAVFLDARNEHFRPSDQDRFGDALVHHDLHRPQHAFVLALAEHHPGRVLLCRAEHRLHDQAGVIDKLR